jgi:hypothetical protein
MIDRKRKEGNALVSKVMCMRNIEFQFCAIIMYLVHWSFMSGGTCDSARALEFGMWVKVMSMARYGSGCSCLEYVGFGSN